MSDSAVASPETSRRRLLAWLGVGGAAALATLFSRDEAQAGHDGTNTLHLGEFNEAPPGASTGVEATAEIFALRIHNESTGPDAGGILASSRGEQAAIKGNAFDPSPTGVQGISLTSTEELGAHQGVLGLSGSGVGVEGGALTGTGVFGHSETGTGLRGESVNGTGVEGVHSGPEFGIGVAGEGTVGVSGQGAFLGVAGDNQGGEAAVKGIGARDGAGPDPAAPFPFELRGTGVVGKSFDGIGVYGQSESPTAPAVLGESRDAIEREGDGPGSGPGVVGRSGSGPGLRGESLTGFGLEVLGKAAFSTVGSAVVAGGQSSAFVTNPAVTADSHIAITLVSDPGRRAVRWVERAAGSGFTVHLTAPAQGDLTLTYSIVEPLAAS